MNKVAASLVFTERRVQRLIFAQPKTLETNVTVNAGATAVVSFTLSEK